MAADVNPVIPAPSPASVVASTLPNEPVEMFEPLMLPDAVT